MKRSFAFFASIACLSLFGCSSSSSDSSGGGGTSLQTACSDISNTFCSKYNSCAAIFVTLSYGDLATCQARAIRGCTTFPTAKGSTITGDQIEACSKAVSAASCDTILNGGFNALPECNIKGTLDNGAACGQNFQCKSGFCPTGTTSCGTCAPLTNAGDACVNGACSGGLSCAMSSGTGKCVAAADAGADCGPTTAVCKSGYGCVSGKCTADLADGAACDLASGPACSLIQGDVCKTSGTGTTGSCAKITLPKTGEACDRSSYWTCAGSAKCSVKTGSGTCVAPAADGAACDDAAGPGCLSPAKCVSKVCKLADVNACN